MRLVTLLLPATLLALSLSTAAEAQPRGRCDVLGTSDGPQVITKFGIRIGPVYTREQQEVFDKMELRKRGINARTATRTSDGCIEAWVPNGDGTFNTQYYDEDTFELKFD